MPAYYNPNNLFPATYYQNMVPGYSSIPSVPTYPSASAPVQNAMEWVEGEVGAKAFQRPAWLTPNQAIPLWDNSDTVIYLKSWNPMGMPNPMQVLRYELPKQQAALPSAQQSETAAPAEEYVTRKDFEEMLKKLDKLEGHFAQKVSANVQNGSNPAVQQGMAVKQNGQSII